jgi:hypothetical protein
MKTTEIYSRRCILGRIGTKVKNLETFAPRYSQSPPPADFAPLPHDFLRLEISTATAESGRGLGFVYIISLFTFDSSIVLCLIAL